MKILIIGSGLIGVTTAYVLRRAGHDVTVIEREEGPGLQTSFANGALLTPSMSDPWNAPGSWRVLLGSLARSDAPLQLRLASLPALASWGIGFLRNSSPSAFERNTLKNLRLAAYSLEVMASLRGQIDIEYGRMALGTLSVFRDSAALDRAAIAAYRLSSHGLSFRRLSVEETIELEPALAPIAKQLSGALHYPFDEAGNAYRFCVGLALLAGRQGVEFRFGTSVTSLEVHAGQVTTAMTARERLVADRYIVAAGSYSTPLLRRIGIHLPVRPAKGYSMTFDCPPSETSLRIPIVDCSLHAAVVPLEGAIRVAGTAEFAGYDLSLPASRIRKLQTLIRDVLPQAHLDMATAKAWCGLRPMSVDGVPIIGATALPNLLVNTGHGHLGWTMAAGSAQLLADVVSGHRPSIDPGQYAFARFGGSVGA